MTTAMRVSKFSHCHRLKLGVGTGTKLLGGWILGGFGGSVNGDAIDHNGPQNGLLSLHLNHHHCAKLSLEIGATYKIPE